MLDYKKLVDSYVKAIDWRVKENSTVTYSVGGLILSNSGAVKGWRRGVVLGCFLMFLGFAGCERVL